MPYTTGQSWKQRAAPIETGRAARARVGGIGRGVLEQELPERKRVESKMCLPCMRTAVAGRG